MLMYFDNATNLDFIELLLKEGAHSNSQDYMGRTPLMFTIQLAPGAAKFMPNSLRPRR
jgi:ankyrin repeat protein